MRVFPLWIQVDPIPAEYVGDVAFEAVVEGARETGAATMESNDADGGVATWLIVPVENREFYRRLDERLASRGLTANTRSTQAGLLIGG